MTENSEYKSTERVSMTTLIVAIVLSVVGTIAFLESQNMIKHNENKDDYVVGDLKAIFIERQDEEQYRLSHKASNLSSACHQGYLFVVADKNPNMQGIVVDYKNRGIRCPEPESSEDKSESETK